MQISRVVPQLRTTDLAASIDFYTSKLGFTLELQFADFYADVRRGDYVVHLKPIDATDPSIPFVARGEHFHPCFSTDDVAREADALKSLGVLFEQDVHETAWGTRDCIIKNNEWNAPPTFDPDAFNLTWILEHVAPLYENRGDRRNATEAYTRVAELWKTADLELQPRVKAAREHVYALRCHGVIAWLPSRLTHC